MDVIIFNQTGGVRHGRFHFIEGVPYGFDDPDAAPYFKACGWADDAAEGTEPKQIIALEEIDIDPCTVWGEGLNKGKFVMPDRAAKVLNMSIEAASVYIWNGEELNRG
jgi:hypothetical protein